MYLLPYQRQCLWETNLGEKSWSQMILTIRLFDCISFTVLWTKPFLLLSLSLSVSPFLSFFCWFCLVEHLLSLLPSPCLYFSLNNNRRSKNVQTIFNVKMIYHQRKKEGRIAISASGHNQNWNTHWMNWKRANASYSFIYNGETSFHARFRTCYNII